ncbi:MAG: SRPBCC family protein [bacterium]
MKTNFTAQVEIEISSIPSKVWDALTNPDMIKQYFFGTEAVSDWKVGSPLLFKGVWEDTEYLDKGIILKMEIEKLFQYSYLSSFSNLPDIPENYATITYELSPSEKGTKLVVTQDNIASEEAQKHSEQSWLSVLSGLKNLVEAK